MASLFFVNEHTGNRYDVVRFDRNSGDVVLKGPLTGREFTQKFDREAFLKMGYKLQQEA